MTTDPTRLAATFVSTGRLPEPGRVQVLVGDVDLPFTLMSVSGAGKSVKGQLAARFLSRELGLDILAPKTE